jgi:hypothetical protein
MPNQSRSLPHSPIVHLDDDDDLLPYTQTATATLRSESPPPRHVTEQEDRHRQTGKALQAQWNNILEGLYNMSMSAKLEERHDQERMRNMISDLQAMIPNWQEAVGQRAAGAAQSRFW